MSLIKTVRAVLERKMQSANFDLEILRRVTYADVRGRIEPMHMRHLLEICTGEVHTVDDGIHALQRLFPFGYVIRRTVRHGHRIYVFQGACLRSPRTLMRFLCQRFRATGRNGAHRLAYVHLKINDWTKYRASDRAVWERWTLFGEYPGRIAYHLDLPVSAVRAALTRHRAEAGIPSG